MSTIEKFEDLIVWQKSRVLCNKIFDLSSRDRFSTDYRFVSQINSSSGSVMDNIAEGFERDGNKEFIQFLYISKGSNGEFRSQLYRALDKKYITESEFKELYALSQEIRKMMDSPIYTLKNSGHLGRKYKPIQNS